MSLDVKKTSYALGLDIGNSMKNLPLEVDTVEFLRAFEDILGGKPLALSQEEFQETMQAFQVVLQEEGQKRQNEASGANVETGDKYREDNAARDEVTVTETGLHHEVIEAGEGSSPAATDTVTVHYTGTLIDGTEFDSSVKRGVPATFALNQVIPGWTEGLQLMKVGGKSRFVIPADLAYGARGAGEVIGPDATLVFEVELIEVQ